MRFNAVLKTLHFSRVLSGNPKGFRSTSIEAHRVIGVSGHLTGFGGGLDNKKFLLSLEQRSSAPNRKRAKLMDSVFGKIQDALDVVLDAKDS